LLIQCINQDQIMESQKRSKDFILPERERKGVAMFKELGIIIGGIFVGAVGAEIIRKKYPNALDKLYTKTREITLEAKEAFKKGYENTGRSRQAVELSV